MKIFCEREVIILPTLDTNTKIWMSDNNVLYFDPYRAKDSKLSPYEMFVITKFMILRDGDWKYHTGTKLLWQHKFGEATTPLMRKVIASSGKQYGIPLIPDDFQRWYCNSLTLPEQAKIEYEKGYEDELDYGDNGPEFVLRYKGLQLTTTDGFVNIQY